MPCSCDMPLVIVNESTAIKISSNMTISNKFITQWRGVPISQSLSLSHYSNTYYSSVSYQIHKLLCRCSQNMSALAEWTKDPMIRLPGETASESLAALAVLLPSLCLRCLAVAWSWQTWALASD